MSIDSNLRHPKSDRVLGLSATCIRAAVRFRYGYDVPLAEVIDLARVHDVPTAVRLIGEKLELFKNIPHTTRLKLATAEAAFTGNLLPKENLDHTISVRRASIGIMGDNMQAGVSREVLVAKLRELRRDWEEWAREYARFTDRLASLYAQAKHELKLLHLEPKARAQAAAELEKVLLVALRKARDLEPYTQAAA